MSEERELAFHLSDSKLDIKKLKEDLENPQAGALVTFEGWVRNHNEGRSVERLDYEAFETLAEAEGNRIIEEAKSRFEIAGAQCMHRVGRLIIGDCAVWVGVTAAHREAAFQAARYIIDQVKIRLPIWKKEHYQDGEAVWVNCQQCHQAGHAHSHAVIQGNIEENPVLAATREIPVELPPVDEVAYYQRQTVLPEVGADGQRKLKAARVFVVGAGGLGSAALAYLAGAGVGHIGLCEPDALEISNLHRQVLYAVEGLGQPKAELAKAALQRLNPTIQIETYPFTLDANHAAEQLESYDVILDCSDNFKTRLLLNQVALQLRKPLIQASIYQFEGQIHRLIPGMGGCLQCQLPLERPEGTLEEAPGSCTSQGVLGPVVGVLGAMQAMETLKFLLGLPSPLDSHLLMIDLLSHQNRLIQRVTRPDCPVCAPLVKESAIVHAEASALDSMATLLDPVVEDEDDSPRPWELDFSEPGLKLSNFLLIDVNEAREAVPILDLPGENIPFSRFELDHPPPLDREKQYLLYCIKGIRSTHLARELRKRGYDHVFALKGGLAKQNLVKLRQRELDEKGLYYVGG